MATATQNPGVYDPETEGERSHPDLGPGHNRPAGDASDPRGPGPDSPDSSAVPSDELRSAEQRGDQPSAGGGGTGNIPGQGTNDDDESGDGNGEADDSGLYNAEGDRGRFGGLRQRGRGNNLFKTLKKRKRAVAAGITIGGAITSVLVFLLSGAFGLTNFMKNVEAKGFLRYQVDLNGRSTAWIEAYMELRFGEIDDPNLAPKDRDNLLFRANSVSTNKPLTDWYRTLRASSFEQDLFGEQGIRFTSVAYKEGNIIKFRPGVITFVNTDTRLTFDPSQAAFDAIARGDPNVFNGELRNFVETKVYQNDKEARAAIKAAIAEHYPNWWKAVKRWHLRQDIQNMIGVRSWRFFDTTRTKVHETQVSIRNKIITAALPEDSKTGNFIKCLFGIPDCTASSDPANPAANDFTPTGTQKEGDKTDGNPRNPQPVGDGTGQDSISAGAQSATSGEATGSAAEAVSKIASKILSKASLFSLLDSLSRFDQSIHNHSLSKIVRQAKAAQVAGIYTVFNVASDQLTTGQLNSDEVNSFMKQFANPTNGEGWATVVDPNANATAASADSTDPFTAAKNKKEFCSTKYQNAMDKPINRQTAENEFQYLCPEDRVGGANQAQDLENAWNDGPGFILHPVLAAYHAVTGGIFDIFNAITGAITGAVTQAALAALGLQQDVTQLASWAAAQALNFGGANINIDDNTPSGQVGNDIIQGGGVLGETSMRDQGAAITNSHTRALANQQDLAYQQDQEHTGFVNRYLALSNPQSLLSRELFALSNFRLGNLGQDILGIFGSTLSNSFRALSEPVHAATEDGYAAANFAGIETYDFPKQCLKASPLTMTPQTATNAVALGIFKPSELNWDMMSNKQTWYTALYNKIGDNEGLAKKVWNCALLDNTARGGIGAQYGYKGEDAYSSDGSGSSSNPGNTTGPAAISDNAQQVAKDILANNNISYQYSAKDDVTLTSQGKNGTNNYPIDVRLLQIVDALGQNHKVVVSAFESYGQGHTAGSDHYTGHAVDIASIDGQTAYKNITDFYSEFSQYADNTVFLQGDCPGAKPAPSGMNRLPGDTCDHQHISAH